MTKDHSLDRMASLRAGEVWYAASAMTLHVENGAWLNTKEVEMAKAAVIELVKALAIQEQRLTEQPIKQRAA